MKVGFLTLPAEVRVMVYDYYFLPPAVLDLVPPLRDSEQVAASENVKSSSRIALTLTCRTVRSECLDLAFSTTAFHVAQTPPPANLWGISAVLARPAALCERISCLSATAREAIRYLALSGYDMESFHPRWRARFSGPDAPYALRPDSPHALPNLRRVALSPTGGYDSTALAGACVGMALLQPRLEMVAALTTFDPRRRVKELEELCANGELGDQMSDVAPRSRVESELNTLRGHFRSFLYFAIRYIGDYYVDICPKRRHRAEWCVRVNGVGEGWRSRAEISRDREEVEGDAKKGAIATSESVRHVGLFYGPTDFVRARLNLPRHFCSERARSNTEFNKSKDEA